MNINSFIAIIRKNLNLFCWLIFEKKIKNEKMSFVSPTVTGVKLS